MADTIFLLNESGELVEMTESHYLTENDFQKLLADYPKLISGDQIDKENPRRWLLITREMGVADNLSGGNRWSLDHLFIDQDAIPTLVEVKRGTDTRLRREVIGQILDYAANAVTYWSIQDILSQFERTCESTGKNPANILNEFLSESYLKDKFWDTVHTNLKAGKIRLLLIADVIPKEMQRIIEFLNEQMSPCEILGIEIKQFLGQNLKTLVPRVIGATATAQTQKTVRAGTGQQWNEERFFGEIAVRSAADVETYRAIYQRSKAMFDGIAWGSGNRTASFSPYLNAKGLSIQLFFVYSYGAVEFQFQHLKNKEPFKTEESRMELASKLNAVLNNKIPIGAIDKRPSIKVSEFGKGNAMAEFFDVVEWFINKIKAYYGINHTF